MRKKSFAEQGLAEVQEEMVNVPETPVETDTGGEDEFIAVSGGADPVDFFYQYNPSKKPTKFPTKILEPGTVLAGVYERHFVAGKYKNPTFIILLNDGRRIGLPGAGSAENPRAFRNRMLTVAEGAKVKITYNGRSTIKNGKWAGNEAHDFILLASKLKA